MAAGEGGIVVDSAVEIVASGAAVGSGAMSAASSSLALATYQTRNFRTLIFEGTMSGSPTDGDTIDIYERALNIGPTTATDDANAPTSAYKHKLVGSFKLDSGGTSQLIVSNKIPVAEYDVEYYLFVNTASVTLSSTWKLDAKHWSYNASQS